MLDDLGTVTLKSGEPMHVVKTTAPEPAWADRILPFLHHKGDLWLEPMRRAYAGEALDDLIMSDFLGLLAGQVVGNITTVENRGVAILQHVFVPPEHRRKGIASFLMAALCNDFVSRGGRAMYLGTAHNSPPYHLYERYGFRGRGDSGKMTWLPDPGFPTDWFAPDSVSIRDTRWDDWPRLEALYAVNGQWQLKGYFFGQFGHTGYESQYLSLRRGMEQGQVQDVKVMCTPRGAVVGHAFVATQPGWQGRVHVLDCMVHAHFYPHVTDLLRAVRLPTGKTQAFCDERAETKMAALEAVGFQREGVFRAQMQDENHRTMDVVVYGYLGD